MAATLWAVQLRDVRLGASGRRARGYALPAGGRRALGPFARPGAAARALARSAGLRVQRVRTLP